jgi:RNA polymerase sigma-70 factor (ECF subfamily)
MILSAEAPAHYSNLDSRRRGHRLEDRELRWRICIQEIGSGDSEALARLYRDTSPMLYGVALRMLANPADAEEVVLDVYQQVWRSAATYDAGRSRVLWWLSMLTRSRALDRLRMNRRRSQMETPVEELPEFPSADRTPDAAVMDQDRKRIQMALAALPAEQRKPLELAFFSDLTHVEIAAKLGTPLGTIKTRIRTAMRTLKEILGDAPETAAGHAI